MIYGKLLILACVVCFVVDLSGFTQTWKGKLGKWLGVPVGSCKPFDCSLCMTWWCGLFYAACAGEFRMGVVGYIALLALFASTISEVLQTLKDSINALLRYVGGIIDKL